MDSPRCIRSNASLMSGSGIVWVIMSSMAILRPCTSPRSGHLGPALGPAERGATPHPARHQLERAGGDLGAGRRHADDHRFSPSLVAAFQGLAHRGDVADAFETVVGAAARQFHEVANDVVPRVVGVDEIRHAELPRRRLARRVDVNAHNHVGADHAKPLDDVQPDAAEPEHHAVRPWLDLGRVDDRADPRRDTAADVADLLEGSVFANLRHRNFRQDRVVREGRRAHVVQHRLAAKGEPAGPVGHHAPALGLADGLAQVGLAGRAVLALPALGRVQGDHVVAGLDRRHVAADIDDHARALVPQDGREHAFGIIA